MLHDVISGDRIKCPWLLSLAADFVAIAAAYYTTIALRFHSEWGAHFFTVFNQALGVRETAALPEPYEIFYLASGPRIVLFLTLTLCALYALLDLYPGRRFLRKRPIAWSVMVANAAALVLFYAYFYLSRNVYHPRSIFATVLAINVILCVSLRGALERWLGWLRARFSFDRCRVVLIGVGEEAEYVNALIGELHPHGLEVAQRLKAEPGESFDQTAQRVRQAATDRRAEMVIAADREMTVGQIMRLLELAEELAVPLKVLSDRLDVVVNQARLHVDMIHGYPLVHFAAPRRDWAGSRAARLGSRLLGAVLLLLLLPLMGVIALLIRISSPGPVFFVQERIGVDRRPFLMFKFRTMHNRAEELQAQVEEFNESGRGLFKIRKDPRVTPVGRFLRRFSLDELPQFLNVARGEMVLVGPRPLPRRDFENYYEQWHYSRHTGLPGLTCLWQVSGRSEIDFHNMCILDVYYLRNRNVVLDLRILLKTVWAVLFAKGAY
jgi:exopolysaccharide biosynthesis polyprenyl glycosylphosphotransferase